MALILVLSLAAAACSRGGNSGGTSDDGGTTLEFWTFNELHDQFYQHMAERWNEANPDRKINLKGIVYPYDDMHNKLLVALQSGTGAPDLADVELNKFPNFLKGTPQLAPLNDIVEPELDNLVRSRLDIYAKDGNYYGIDFHVGASVIYYNREILDQAGVNPDDIKTWDDFEAAGRKVLEATGKPMPAWNAGEPRSAGMGGTGTVITTASKHMELAKDFLAYAKLSREGNIEIWRFLGFDPLRSDVWDAPELREPNKFTDYFGDYIFDVLLEVEDEIEGVVVNEQTPAISDAFRTSVLVRILQDGEDPVKVLEETQSQLN
jgi:ABC-type glycerol-3-phosphate transport system substrate-binding protein